MLLAPPTPTHTHEDRLSHSRAPLSPPTSSHSPTSPSPHSNKRRASSPPQLLTPMNEVASHFTTASTSIAHTPTQGRSPQASVTPTSSAQTERVSSGSSMGVLPSTQSMTSVTTSSMNSLGAAGGATPILPVTGGVGGTAQTPPLHHPLLGYVPHGNKILSRNLNGTLAVTNQPNNESELQLYRVLQRANLLTYYDTFISQGGDDVQQLCEAGEEEFLEIMALVGMASKPLHVRRLQKALQEWVSNPPLFQIPLLPNLPPSVVAGFPTYGTHRGMMSNSTPPTRPSPPMTSSSMSHSQNHSSSPGKDGPTPTSNSLGGSSPRDVVPLSTSLSRDGMGPHGGSRGPSPGMNPHLNSSGMHIPPASIALQNCQSVVGPDKNPEFFLQIMKNAGCESPGLNYPPPSGSPVGGSPMGGNSPQGSTPTLHEAQIARLAQSASELVANLPSLEPRKDAFANKRKMSKELELIMNMSEDDPRRMEEIRKYAAIYGRFDCKRKPEKPLTMHEVSVNEAAAQICKYMPALLTRRDELFPLARQVVRDSGYQYSKGHSRSQTVIGRDDELRGKRARLDSGPDQDSQWKKRHERLEAISDELRAMSDKAEDVRNSLTSGTGNISDLTQQMDAIHSRHAQLTMEQNELIKAQQKSYELKSSRSRNERTCSDETRTDDSDSQFSYSANNSPSQPSSANRHSLLEEALKMMKASFSESQLQKPNQLNQSHPSHYQKEGQSYNPHYHYRKDYLPNGAEFRSDEMGVENNHYSQDNATMIGRDIAYNDDGLRHQRQILQSTSPSPHVLSPPFRELFATAENKVISSSQGNIIAVANPALSMSSAMPPSLTQLQDDDRHMNPLYSMSHNHNGNRSNSSSIKQEPNSPGNPKQE